MGSPAQTQQRVTTRTGNSIGYRRLQSRRKRTGAQYNPLDPGGPDPESTRPVKASRTRHDLDDAEHQPADGETRTKSKATGDRRNAERVHQRDERDHRLMSKYLPTSVEDVFDEVIRGPDDAFTPPSWLLDSIREVVNSPARPPKAPPVRFGTDDASLTHNAKLLEEFDYDLGKLLEHTADTTLGYGSEFRPTDQLNKIFGGHPLFSFFKRILAEGMDYHFTKEISESERQRELEANLERGNHKSATLNPSITEAALEKDVRHGFSLPFPSDLVKKLKGSLVQPCGLASQFALKADGSREKKHRLTHDLSYEITGKGISVNNRVDMSRYPEMIFGWCLPRTIHFVVALRIAHPRSRILIAKYDFSDAYRRIAHSARAASQTIVVLAEVAFLALRLSFGGAPNPPTWCSFSEMVTDLSNEIPLCDWNPSELHSPGQPRAPTPKTLDDSVPIAPGRSLAVTIPTTVTARTDSFIDDLIRVFLDTEENRTTQPHVVPLAVFAANRPHAGSAEPIPRWENISGPKLEAEGTPAETQIVLGWELDTRRLLVSLPFDKFTAWSEDVAEAIRAAGSTLGELATTVGRLNHAAFVIPLSRHFLGRLRRRTNGVRNAKQEITFSREELADLHLWLNFLLAARGGISMNLLTIRKPRDLRLLPLRDGRVHVVRPRMASHSTPLRNLPAAGRDLILRGAHAANSRIVYDSVQPKTNEDKDRTWRRWIGFGNQVGILDPFVSDFPEQERELLLRAFLSTYRTGRWHQSGALLGSNSRALAGASVRAAAGHLAAAFRDNFQRSPLHVQDGTRLLPSFAALFKALDNASPPPQRQRAITPKFLRYLHRLGSTGQPRACALDHAVDLLIAGFFFATRPCEIVYTKQPGKTKTLELRDLVFRDDHRRIIPHSDPMLPGRAEFVTVTWRDQKNGNRMDSRTQRRTQDPLLCPCTRLGRSTPHCPTHDT